MNKDEAMKKGKEMMKEMMKKGKNGKGKGINVEKKSKIVDSMENIKK